MRKLAKILTIVAMALLVFIVVMLFGVNIQVESVTKVALSGEDHEARIMELIEIAQRDDMSSDLFKRPVSTDYNDYQLLEVTVTLKNTGIIPAQWARLVVTPGDMDYAQFTSGAKDIQAFGALTTIQTTLLSGSGAAEPADIALQYYKLGRLMGIII